MSIVSVTILLFSCVLSHTPLISNISNYSNVSENHSDSITPEIEVFSYDSSYSFPLIFNVDSDESIISINYDEDGFDLVSFNTINPNQLCIYLIVSNNLSESLLFTLYATLSNNDTISCSVYGYLNSDFVYIHYSSFFAAKSIYYANILDNGIITEEDYKDLLRIDFSCGVEENIEVTPSRNPNLHIYGLLLWKDDWEVSHNLQHIKVNICDNYDPTLLMPSNLLATVYTNDFGYFSYSCTSSPTGRKIYIEVIPEGENNIVRIDSSLYYVWKSAATQPLNNGDSVSFSTVFDMTTAFGQALQIFQAVNTSAKYVKEMIGTNIFLVVVYYPNTDTYYSPSQHAIYLNSGVSKIQYGGKDLFAYASWDVIMHEYSHHIQHELGISLNPGKTHWIDTNMYDHYTSNHGEKSKGNCLDSNGKTTCANPNTNDAKDYAIKIAYPEAWATIFSAIVQQHAIDCHNLDPYIKTIGDDVYTAYNNYDLFFLLMNNKISGEATEHSIMGLLWALYDEVIKKYDSISLGHLGFWNLTVNGHPKTLSEVINRYYSLYPTNDDLDKIGNILEYFGMAPANIVSTTLVQDSLPTFSWTENGTSSTLLNNKFIAIFYDTNKTQILTINNILIKSIALNQTKWNNILASQGNEFYIAVVGYQTNYPTTGGYISKFYMFTKPTLFTFTSINSNTEYAVSAWPNYQYDSNISIPNSYEQKPVTQILSSAFYNQSTITEIYIPSSITSIGNNAFYNCSNLEYVHVARSSTNGLTTLGASGFYGCSKLKRIYIIDASSVIAYRTATNWSNHSNKYELEPGVICDHPYCIGNYYHHVCQVCFKNYVHIYNNIGICMECGYDGTHTHSFDKYYTGNNIHNLKLKTHSWEYELACSYCGLLDHVGWDSFPCNGPPCLMFGKGRENCDDHNCKEHLLKFSPYLYIIKKRESLEDSL